MQKTTLLDQLAEGYGKAAVRVIKQEPEYQQPEFERELMEKILDAGIDPVIPQYLPLEKSMAELFRCLGVKSLIQSRMAFDKLNPLPPDVETFDDLLVALGL